MGKGDISDQHQSGVGLDDLAKAAKLSEAILPTNWAELQDAGLATVAALREQVLKAQSAADAQSLISRLLEDEAKMRSVGIAYQHRTGVVTAAFNDMRQVRGLASAVKDLDRETRRWAKLVSEQAEEREDKYRSIVLDKLLSALGAKGIKAPRGYRVDAEDGVIAPDNEVVCDRPLVVLGLSKDVDSDTTRMQLAWLTPSGWRTKHVLRSTCMNHRKLVDLADEEFPVSSVTASQVVKYLMACETENQFVSRRSVTHMGWSNDIFLHGTTSIGGELFLEAEDGTKQLVAACKPSGTLEGWKEAVRADVVSRPMVLLGIYASCASAMLHPLDRDGFVWEWSGESSRGKSTSETVAASVWGRPDVRGLIGKWNAAGISGFLTTAWFMQSMPLFLDETKEADPETVRQIMYTHVSGRDRVRAKKDGGLRRTETWRSALMSTGETPMTSVGKDQGARARVICLNGPPLGEDSEENRQAAERLVKAMLENHGHMGPRFVEVLLGQKDRWVELRGRYHGLAKYWASQASTAMSRRLMEQVAVIDLTAQILHNECGLPGDPEEALRVLGDVVLESEASADLPRAAIADLYSWISSNEEKFWRRVPKCKEPNGGWLGRWEDDPEWDCIGIVPTVVEQKLKEWGYDVSAVLIAWTSRGWRLLDKKGHNPNWGRNSSRLVVLAREAVDPERSGADEQQG